MLRKFLKIPVSLLFIFALSTCIDPYYPELSKYQSLLVVDGLVTDQDASYEVRLTRTFQSTDSIPVKVNDAKVFITDESGIQTNFYFAGNGIYKSQISAFRGETGKTYTLHIETGDGRRYESAPCSMLPVAGIDSIYYSREEMIDKTYGNLRTGLMIYIDTDDNADEGGNFRWEFDETWKFAPPSPKEYIYYTDTDIVEIKDVKRYCWKNVRSGNVMINSVLPGHSSIKKEPLIFIATAESDRLTIQYSVLIKQFSISPQEFSFWNNLRQVNEAGGNIYDTQPYPVVSNIFNVDDPDEKVLGYFKVSAVRERRIFITYSQISQLGLPDYQYPCIEYKKSPEDYPAHGFGAKPPTWDEINEMFMAQGFIFVKPIYLGLPPSKILQKLVFAPAECSDCEKTGTIKKPDFWIDLQ